MNSGNGHIEGYNLIWKYKVPTRNLWDDIFTLDLETEPIKDVHHRKKVMKGLPVFGVIYDGDHYFRFTADRFDDLKSKIQDLASYP